MPAVTVNDLNNAQLDVTTIASVATSPAATVTDRLGNTKNTLAGMNAAVLASAAAVQGSIGYLPPVAYSAGISLTLAAQTVGYLGQTYAPILSALPFTTSGTFETAKFRLIQGVSGADLAASGGAAMVGYLPLGAGADAADIQTTVRRHFIDANSWVSPTYSASTNVSRWAMMVSFINTLPAGCHVRLSRGVYPFNGSIAHPRKTLIQGEGRLSTTLAFSHAGDGLQSISAINSSVGVFVDLRDIGLTNSNAANTGGGFVDVGGTFVDLSNVYFQGFKYGTILNQSELVTINRGHYEIGPNAAGVWIVNGPEHTVGALPNFTNRITVSCSQFNGGNDGIANILDDGGINHCFRENNFNGTLIGIRAAGVFGLNITGNESEVHLDADFSLFDTKNNGAYIGPCVGFTITNNVPISSSGGKNINIQSGSGGVISSNIFGQAASAILFSGGNANRSSGVIIEGNSKLITGQNRTTGVFVNGFTRSSSLNTIRQNAATFVPIASAAGTVTVTPATMEFISIGTKLNLVNELDGSNSEDTTVISTTATTFTVVLALSKAANFLVYGGIPSDQNQGTFLPTLGATVTNGTHTYSFQNGQYTKHGNKVFARGYISISSKDPAISGSLVIRGLPFKNNIGLNSDTVANLSVFSGFTFPAGYTQLSGNIGSNQTPISLLMSGSGQALNAVNASCIAGSTVLVSFSIEYFTGD